MVNRMKMERLSLTLEAHMCSLREHIVREPILTASELDSEARGAHTFSSKVYDVFSCYMFFSRTHGKRTHSNSNGGFEARGAHTLWGHHEHGSN